MKNDDQLTNYGDFFELKATTSDDDDDDDDSNQAIVISVTVICGVLLVGFVIFLVVWRRRRLSNKQLSTEIDVKKTDLGKQEQAWQFLSVDYLTKNNPSQQSISTEGEDSRISIFVDQENKGGPGSKSLASMASSTYVPISSIGRSDSGEEGDQKRVETDINVNFERDLKILSVLGSGGFGVVYKALWNTRSGEQIIVAVKVLNSTLLQQKLDDKQVQKVQDIFYEEINIMLKLDHPCIVKFYGASLKPQYLSLLMEFVDGGSLQDVLYNNDYGRRLSYAEILNVLESLASALCYLHPTIVHKDLKPQNILVGSQGLVKIADFGLSQIKAMEKTLSYQHAIGTPAYLPPEAWTTTSCTSKCDIYQLGMLAWELWTMKKPWQECEIVGQILNKVVVEKARPEIPQETPQFLVNLINKCWQQDPEQRPTAQEVLLLVQRELSRTHQS